MNKKRYLKNPSKCLYCGSDDVEFGDEDMEELDCTDEDKVYLTVRTKMRMRVHCNACDKTWRNSYTLTDVIEDDIKRIIYFDDEGFVNIELGGRWTASLKNDENVRTVLRDNFHFTGTQLTKASKVIHTESLRDKNITQREHLGERYEERSFGR